MSTSALVTTFQAALAAHQVWLGKRAMDAGEAVGGVENLELLSRAGQGAYGTVFVARWRGMVSGAEGDVWGGRGKHATEALQVGWCLGHWPCGLQARACRVVNAVASPEKRSNEGVSLGCRLCAERLPEDRH